MALYVLADPPHHACHGKAVTDLGIKIQGFLSSLFGQFPIMFIRQIAVDGHGRHLSGHGINGVRQRGEGDALDPSGAGQSSHVLLQATTGDTPRPSMAF